MWAEREEFFRVRMRWSHFFILNFVFVVRFSNAHASLLPESLRNSITSYFLTSQFIMIGHCLLASFCASITLWYVSTPYLVEPSPKVIQDLLKYTAIGHPTALKTDKSYLVENWTKWRLYYNDSNSKTRVIYKHSREFVKFDDKEMVFWFEWRPEHKVRLNIDKVKPSAEVEKNWYDKFGIYDHLTVKVEDGYVFKILPKFMFGIDFAHLDRLYEGPGKMPIIGLLGPTAFYDRLVILGYLAVILSVIAYTIYSTNLPKKLE